MPQLGCPHQDPATVPLCERAATRRLQVQHLTAEGQVHEAPMVTTQGQCEHSEQGDMFANHFLYFKKCSISFKLWLVYTPIGSR